MGCSAMSVLHNRSVPAATNFRCTRSWWTASAGRCRCLWRWLIPRRPVIRSSRATRLRLTRTPIPSRSSACTAACRLVRRAGRRAPVGVGDELGGSTFSRDGPTPFVNIQASAGMTFAIWGRGAGSGSDRLSVP
jgi:hypothetical protein